MDCYEVLESLSLFWKNQVYKFFKNMTLGEKYDKLCQIINHSYILFGQVIINF